MAKVEPAIFEHPDSEADEQAMLEGEVDADAERVVPHAEVSEWLETWGTANSKSPPPSWFK
jgi:predicted transcriptional regulator